MKRSSRIVSRRSLLAEVWGFDADDVHLVCSPFHHSVAIRFGGGTLLAGGTVVVLGRFQATAVVEAVARHRPTTTFMVPAHLQRLFALVPERERGSLAGFRLVAHAGAPCPEPLKRAAIDVFGPDAVREFYGSTEGQFTVCSAPEWLERPGTVGRARPRRRLEVDAHGVIWCEVPESRIACSCCFACGVPMRRTCVDGLPIRTTRHCTLTCGIRSSETLRPSHKCR